MRFSFEGREIDGFAGDTIASALAANGIRLLSRSFKYHRPRGSMSMSGDDGGALVQVGDEPNVWADVREVESGMTVVGQNYVGSLESDQASILERFRSFLPVGFYYRAFFRPRGVWNYWEKLIRQTAGLGRVNPDTPKRYYDKTYEFCDVAVIGGGPAGLAAAAEAAKAGADVLLVERGPALGGSLAFHRFAPDTSTAARTLSRLRERVADLSNVRVMTNAACTGWFTDNWLSIISGNRLHKLRARSVVACTGVLEQPPLFRANDLPGILFGGAAQRLIKSYGVRPGRRAVVFTSSGDGYGVALDLADSGVDVAAIVDPGNGSSGDPLVGAARDRGIRVLEGCAVSEAVARPDKLNIAAVLVGRVIDSGAVADERERIDCDLLCVSTGTTPAAGLLCQAGAKLELSESSGSFEVVSIPPSAFAAGSVNGLFDLDAVIEDGRRAGLSAAPTGNEAAPSVGSGGLGTPSPTVIERESAAARRHWFGSEHPDGLDFVDFDEDVTAHDVRDAIAEGFEDIELLKRYTAIGMGPSQGRQSALAAGRLVARETGRPLSEIGATTSRPPVLPEKFGHLAGRGFSPVRRTALHHRHVELDAQIMTSGLWLRPAYYGPKRDRAQLINEEVRAVRSGVGIIDVSTLGGFEVRGPDAAEFLNRMYTLSYHRLRVGRVRYAMVLDDAAVVVDDGVAARLARNHFYVTASTTGAEEMYPALLWRQAQWRLDVDIADVTSSTCAFNLAGPRSRAVLQALTSDIDFSPAAFPYMAVRTGGLSGIPVRVLRIGFVGELGYEVHAPSAQAEALWDALMETGDEFGIRPFAVEAQRVLRLEKGHVIVGQDTDGLTNPLEADMGWALGRRKRYYVGKRSIDIVASKGIARRLVGYRLAGSDGPVPDEGCLVIRRDEIVGRVTSSAWSPTLGRVIGLAYVAPDQTAAGHVFYIKAQDGRMARAEVAALPFYDPGNARQRL